MRRGTGFGMHGHGYMEIDAYLLDGKLEHEDSLGGTSIIARRRNRRIAWAAARPLLDAATDAEVLLFDLS